MAGTTPSRATAERPEQVKASFAPGELLVRYRPGTGAERRRATLERRSATLEERLEAPGLELVRLSPGVSVREAAQAFEDLPSVRYAEPNFYRYLRFVPDDFGFPKLWGLHNTGQDILGTAGTLDADIDAPEAWETTLGNPAVTVAVVDDGLDYSHPDLELNVWRNPGETGAGREANGVDDAGNGFVDDWRGWDFADDDNDPAPVGADGDHGTHVAGTIAATGDNGIGVIGVAPRVRLMPVRVFGSDGQTTIARLVGAYAYASDNGAEVLNGSFGGGGFSQTERNAIAAADETLFAVAAGNSATDNDVEANYPCDYSLNNVVCVAATGQDDRLAPFSNFGQENVDLGAPGVNILSTVRGGYAYFSGTSMATPHVAGAAALLWSQDSAASVGDIRARLLDGVDPLASLADRVASGGRLNLVGALAIQEGGPGLDADATPPTTTITAGPPRRTDRRRARFRFHASEPSDFACKLDAAAWAACFSPQRYRKLSRGRHVFRVRATDLAGNLEDPAKWSWRVTR